jgi:hypothetical protein
MDTVLAFVRDYGWFVGPPLLLVVIAIWVFRPSARTRYRKDGDLPFEDRAGTGSRGARSEQ